MLFKLTIGPYFKHSASSLRNIQYRWSPHCLELLTLGRLRTTKCKKTSLPTGIININSCAILPFLNPCCESSNIDFNVFLNSERLFYSIFVRSFSIYMQKRQQFLRNGRGVFCKLDHSRYLYISQLFQNWCFKVFKTSDSSDTSTEHEAMALLFFLLF